MGWDVDVWLDWCCPEEEWSDHWSLKDSETRMPMWLFQNHTYVYYLNREVSSEYS